MTTVIDCLKCGTIIYETNLTDNVKYTIENTILFKEYVYYCDNCKKLKPIDETNILQYRERIMKRLDDIEMKLNTLLDKSYYYKKYY